MFQMGTARGMVFAEVFLPCGIWVSTRGGIGISRSGVVEDVVVASEPVCTETSHLGRTCSLHLLRDGLWRAHPLSGGTGLVVVDDDWRAPAIIGENSMWRTGHPGCVSTRLCHTPEFSGRDPGRSCRPRSLAVPDVLGRFVWGLM